MKLLALFSITTFCAFLVACNPPKDQLEVPPPPILALTNPTPEQARVIQYAEPLVKNMIGGWQEGNYQKFSRNFDASMKTNFNMPVFVKWVEEGGASFGRFVSRELLKVEPERDTYVLVYRAQFENAPNVYLKYYISKAEPHTLNGFWHSTRLTFD